MSPPLQVLVRKLKLIFERARKEGRNVALRFRDEETGQKVNTRITLAPTHWTTEPFSAYFRIQNLPARLRSGEGLVHMAMLIMPLRPNPKIKERQVKVSIVYKFKGPTIEDFVKEFRKSFAKGWNKK